MGPRFYVNTSKTDFVDSLTLFHPGLQNYTKVRVVQICTTFFLGLFWGREPQKWFPTPFLAKTSMSQLRINLKTTSDMLVQASLLVRFFGSLLLSTGSPLLKLGEFWPVLPPHDRMRFFWALKSSLPFCQPKMRNSQASLQKKIIMYSEITTV